MKSEYYTKDALIDYLRHLKYKTYSKRKIKYINLPAAFDIEVSSFYNPDGEGLDVLVADGLLFHLKIDGDLGLVAAKIRGGVGHRDGSDIVEERIAVNCRAGHLKGDITHATDSATILL